MNRKFENQVKEIFEEFKWHNVHRVMTFLDWEWAPIGSVPDVPDMKKTALRLLQMAWDSATSHSNTKGYSYQSTGGFTAEAVTCDGNSLPTLRLIFELESWEASGD